MSKKNLLSIVILLSCVSSLYAQSDKVLSSDKILRLVPNRIKGFQQLVDPKAMEMKLGTIAYTLCDKKFEDGKRSVKILLFDFKEASIMYNQATREWKDQSVIESDSIIQRSVIMTNCSGWESFNRQSKTAQIFLGICDRFFLTITGENVELEELRKVLGEFKLSEFPK
jgi:hypothetical protein